MDELGHMVPGWTRWGTQCLNRAMERVVLGWMRWNTWCLGGRGGTRGALMDKMEHIHSPCSDEVQEGSMKEEGACPDLVVGCSLLFRRRWIRLFLISQISEHLTATYSSSRPSFEVVKLVPTLRVGSWGKESPSDVTAFP